MNLDRNKLCERWTSALERVRKEVNHHGIVRAAAGKVFEMSNPTDPWVYFVLSGHYCLMLGSGGQWKTLRVCGAGDLLGFGSEFADQNWHYRLSCIEEGDVISLKRSQLERAMELSPALTCLVIEALCRTIVLKDRRIAALQNTSATARVKALLYSLATKFGTRVEAGTLIQTKVDRDAMAQLSGITPQSLSRIISELVDQDLVRRKRRNLILTDLKSFSGRQAAAK